MKKALRKILLTGISATVLIGIISIPVVAVDNSTVENQTLFNTEATNNSPLEKVEIENEDTYETNASSGNCDRYYYNTGQACPAQAVYSDEYDLLNTLKRGDIVYDEAGGFGITGHIAIVEGKFYDYDTEKFHIRLIEPVACGVKRGILDDIRMIEKEVTVLRIKNVTTQQITKALTFCRNQLDKKWEFHYSRNISSTAEKWYCSELIWAAYYNQGINIDVEGATTGPIMPIDIFDCSKVDNILTY